jgi:hypothetical protein
MFYSSFLHDFVWFTNSDNKKISPLLINQEQVKVSNHESKPNK